MYYASTAGGGAMGLVFRKDAEAKPEKKQDSGKSARIIESRKTASAHQESRAA